MAVEKLRQAETSQDTPRPVPDLQPLKENRRSTNGTDNTIPLPQQRSSTHSGAGTDNMELKQAETATQLAKVGVLGLRFQAASNNMCATDQAQHTIKTLRRRLDAEKKLGAERDARQLNLQRALSQQEKVSKQTVPSKQAVAAAASLQRRVKQVETEAQRLQEQLESAQCSLREANAQHAAELQVRCWL